MTQPAARVACALLLVPSLLASPLAATCGGGGGGGVGGINPSAGSSPTATYHVPWTVVRPGQPAPSGDGLILYWFPTSPEEARASALQSSRNLTLWSARCVAMTIVPSDHQQLRERYAAPVAAPASAS